MFSDQLVPLRKPRVWKDADGGMHVGYPRAGGGVQAAQAATANTPEVIGDPNEKEEIFNRLKDDYLITVSALKELSEEL